MIVRLSWLRAAACAPALLALLASSAPAQSRRVFFGNLHSHTSYSDGSGTPEQAFRHARDSARLDFLAVTEHNHASADGSGDRRDGIIIAADPGLYTGPRADALIPAADRMTRDGHFVAIYGQEYSSISSGNHVNVFDVGSVIDAPNGDFGELVRWMEQNPDAAGRPPIVQLNHPSLFDEDASEYGADDFATHAEWIERLGRYAALIEILNGPAMERHFRERAAEVMERDYLHYLNLGFRLAPTGDQDNHYFTWGTATPVRTAVVADSLTRRHILDAMRARHVYASEDPNLELIFLVDGRLMGDVVAQLPAAGSSLGITVAVRDRDEPDASYEIDVFSDADGPGGEVAQAVDAFTVRGDSPAGAPFTIAGVPYRGEGQYVFFRVRQLDEHGGGDRAWTAPVWFDASGGPSPGPASPAVRIASLLPNPAGDERQNEEVTLRNVGTAIVDLTGWTLRDVGGASWTLSGSLSPGNAVTIRRAGQAMSLNNGGDTITLVDRSGAAVQSVSYPQLPEGVRHDVPNP